jgi:hypothetical protein
VLPPEWLVLDLTAEDLEQAMETASELNPEFAPLISGFGAVAAQGMSLIAMQLDPQAVAVGYPTNFVVVAIPGMGMSLDFVVEATALSVEGMFQGSELISYEMIDDLNGSPAGRIDMLMPLTTMAGSAITVRSTWILMEAGDELIEFTVQAERERYAQNEAELEAVIQSIELIGE